MSSGKSRKEAKEEYISRGCMVGKFSVRCDTEDS